MEGAKAFSTKEQFYSRIESDGDRIDIFFKQLYN